MPCAVRARPFGRERTEQERADGNPAVDPVQGARLRHGVAAVDEEACDGHVKRAGVELDLERVCEDAPHSIQVSGIGARPARVRGPRGARVDDEDLRFGPCSLSAAFVSLHHDAVGLPLAPGCRLCMRGPILMRQLFATDASGIAAVSLTMPVGPPGCLVAVQAVALDSGPVGFTFTSGGVLVAPQGNAAAVQAKPSRR